jgi:hypothetical protein
MLQLPGVSPHLHGKSCLSPIEYDSPWYGKHEFGTRASLYLARVGREGLHARPSIFRPGYSPTRVLSAEEPGHSGLGPQREIG